MLRAVLADYPDLKVEFSRDNGFRNIVEDGFDEGVRLLTALLRVEMPVSRKGRLARSFTKGIRLIVHPADRIAHRHVPVLLEMREGTLRRIDWEMSEIRAAETLQLRVEIGKVAALKQRIVAEVDAGRHVHAS